MDLHTLIYGNTNPCLERETRKWTWTAILINGLNSKAINLFTLIACFLYVTICLHVFYVSLVFISPINSFDCQTKNPANLYIKSYSFLSNYHPINSYSNATPLMFPIHTTPLMFPFYFSVPNTTPIFHIALNKIPSYNPCNLFKWYAPFLHLAYTILGFVPIYKPLSPDSLKLRCYNYCVIGKNLLIQTSYRWIYMSIYTINAIYQATLAKSPIHVLGYYATTLYLGLHILFLHRMYNLKPVLTICLATFYTVLIFRFTCTLYGDIKLPQFTQKADDILSRYKVLEKSIVGLQSFTLFLLSIFSIQLPLLNFLYLIPAVFVLSLFCCSLQINSDSKMACTILYLGMNLEHITCHQYTFYAVQTLTFRHWTLQICTAIRPLGDILYHNYLNGYPLYVWYIFTLSGLLVIVNKYLAALTRTLYCIYMYIYHHHHHQKINPYKPIYWSLSSQKPYFFHILPLIMLIFNLLKTFANSLDPDEARHFVGPDLDPGCFDNMKKYHSLLSSPKMPSTPLFLLIPILLSLVFISHLLITYANSLEPDKGRHFVGPDLDPKLFDNIKKYHSLLSYPKIPPTSLFWHIPILLSLVVISHLLRTYENSLDPDGGRHFVGPDLDPKLFDNMKKYHSLLSYPKILPTSLIWHIPILLSLVFIPHLLITYANSLDPDGGRHFVGPDLDPKFFDKIEKLQPLLLPLKILPSSLLLLFQLLLSLMLILYLLIPLTNRLDPDQGRHFVGPGLGLKLFDNMMNQQPLLLLPLKISLIQQANTTITISNSTPTNPCFNYIHYYYYYYYYYYLTCIILIHYYYTLILLHTLYYYTSCVYSYWYCSLKLSRLYTLGVQFQSIQWI